MPMRMSARMRAWGAVIFLLFCVCGPLEIQAKTLRETLPYEEFESLVKDCVSRVPDLQTLWDWRSQEPQSGQKKAPQDVYFGGGALRGLLHWIHGQLQSHTPQEIRKLQVPSVTDLLILKHVDRDLFVPDSWKAGIKQWKPYSDWDVLGESFYLDSVKSGGSTLEKIKVNPAEVVDPLGGSGIITRGGWFFIGFRPVISGVWVD